MPPPPLHVLTDVEKSELLLAQHEMIERMAARISELESLISKPRKASKNSHIPPSGEIFYRLAEAKVLIEAWRRHYNTVRPHSSLGYRPPVPETASPPYPASGSASLNLRPDMAPASIIHSQSIRSTRLGADQDRRSLKRFSISLDRIRTT